MPTDRYPPMVAIDAGTTTSAIGSRYSIMWPWEHAIVGYLAYSLFCHAYYRESPGGLEAFAVVFASVLPDLIDKPLAWQYGVFESGYALGHSVFFAVPLALAVGAVARSYGRFRAGLAFGVGYLLHLPADVLDRIVRDDHFVPEIVLWPLGDVDARSHGHDHGFTDQFVALFEVYHRELAVGEPSTYVQLQVAMAVFVALLWLYDGAPVLREIVLGGKRLVETAAERLLEYRNS